MSYNRVKKGAGWVWPSALPKGPNGRALCRQCRTEVPKGRRTFCGDACVDEWKLRTDPAFVRVKVYERDHGICALCSLDTDAFEKRLQAYRYENRIKPWSPDLVFEGKRIPSHRYTLWDADHILPVAEGGGECGLENYRTLCYWCHLGATAGLRGRLSKKRRASHGPEGSILDEVRSFGEAGALDEAQPAEVPPPGDGA